MFFIGVCLRASAVSDFLVLEDFEHEGS